MFSYCGRRNKELHAPRRFLSSFRFPEVHLVRSGTHWNGKHLVRKRSCWWTDAEFAKPCRTLYTTINLPPHIGAHRYRFGKSQRSWEKQATRRSNWFTAPRILETNVELVDIMEINFWAAHRIQSNKPPWHCWRSIRGSTAGGYRDLFDAIT